MVGIERPIDLGFVSVWLGLAGLGLAAAFRRGRRTTSAALVGAGVAALLVAAVACAAETAPPPVRDAAATATVTQSARNAEMLASRAAVRQRAGEIWDCLDRYRGIRNGWATLMSELIRVEEGLPPYTAAVWAYGFMDDRQAFQDEVGIDGRLLKVMAESLPDGCPQDFLSLPMDYSIGPPQPLDWHPAPIELLPEGYIRGAKLARP